MEPAARITDSIPPASVPPAPPLHWVKPPQQERSRKTFERILDAAEEIIAQEGLPSLTIASVVRRAGSSVGAFYSRFPDKDALIRTLHDRSCEEAIATADLALDPRRWVATPLDQAVEEVVTFVVELFQQRRGLVLAFSQAVASDPTYAQRRAELGRELGDRFHRLLRDRPDEVTHPDLRVAASFAVRLLTGTLEQETIIQRTTPPENAEPKHQVARELARALLGYLGVVQDSPSRKKGTRP